MAGSASPIDERAARRIGAVLRGKYRLGGVLGVGGMGTVYRAVHRNGGKVAVKVLHDALWLHGDARARFLREGYLANRVDHPGAVRILDDDVAEDGAAFLVMELLRGESLRTRALRVGGRLPWREVVALGRQLLDVLASAHEKGVVHRDIKPDNLFLTVDRVLKVLDFGIARVEDGPGAHATDTGTRLGTPAYMPPEVALGRTGDVDARTDLWSMGATLFALISGKIVHEAETATEVAVRAATVPARSLSAVAGDVPAEVVAIVDRALAFQREDRWPSAREMLAAIDQLPGGPPGLLDIGPVPEGADPGGDLPATPAAGEASTLPDESWVGAETIPEPRATRSGKQGDTTRPATLDEAKPPPEVAPPPLAREAPRRWAGAWALALLPALALAGGAAAGVSRWSSARVPAPASSGIVDRASDAGPRCASNAECLATSGGAAAVCRKESGACVPLATDACQVLAAPGDPGDDATLWIGALFPHRMSDPEHFGRRAANAIELARRDFAEAGGLLPARPGGPRRPIGVVLCDDHEHPERAAAHLVDAVGVPAIIGFATSKEVLDLAGALLLPRGVLGVVATGAASTIRDIPRLPGEPRLVYRVTPASDVLSWPFAAILERILEPELRTAIPPREPIRVAMLRHDSLVGQTTADARVRVLRFNGKSVAENGDAFLQIPRANYIAGGDFTAENERTARALAAFRPQVVIDMPPYPALLAAVERAWPPGVLRPRYLTEGTWNDLGEGILDWRRDGLSSRVYPVDVVSSGPAALRFALRYNELFTPRVTPATALSTPYDAFYVVAYAAAALGDQPITGRGLASAIGRLLPPGEPVEVGTPGIYSALVALSAGRRIDLQGAATTLDFDLDTGETQSLYSLFCLSPASGSPAVRHVASGVLFDAGRREMRGVRRCP